MSVEAVCERCGVSFVVPDTLRERYPDWTPRYCSACYKGSTSAAARPSPTGAPVEDNITVAEVLARYDRGPDSGVFTDGSANPNPGPGGWGAVYVIRGEIVDQSHGHEPHTTNNRMELTALIHGCGLVPEGEATTLYTDSKLCHDTITKWAAGWERRGWKRKTGEIANLDLVQTLYGIFQRRPELRLEWVPAHSGYRWNEYADALSTAWMRETL